MGPGTWEERSLFKSLVVDVRAKPRRVPMWEIYLFEGFSNQWSSHVKAGASQRAQFESDGGPLRLKAQPTFNANLTSQRIVHIPEEKRAHRIPPPSPRSKGDLAGNQLIAWKAPRRAISSKSTWTERAPSCRNKLRWYPQQHAVLFLVLAPPSPRRTLVEPWWNPRKTLPQGRLAPGLRPQTKLSAVGEKEGIETWTGCRFLETKWTPAELVWPKEAARLASCDCNAEM